MLVKTIAFAITAGTRAGLQGSASYAGAPKTGVVMNATGVGEVVSSNSGAFEAGEKVLAPTGWQAYSVHKAGQLSKIDSTLDPVHYLGITGKDTTPFLLARIAEQTDGRSLQANIQLVLNNARLAAQIAVALSGL